MKIKELREKKDITQSELAKIFNIKQATISAYEKEINEPNIEMLIKLSDFFNVSIDYLVEHKTTTFELNTLTVSQRELLDIIKDLNDREIARLKGYIESMKENEIIKKINNSN